MKKIYLFQNNTESISAILKNSFTDKFKNTFFCKKYLNFHAHLS